MAFEQTYFPEAHLILIRVWGKVSLEENHNIGAEMQAQLDQIDTPADVLFDLRGLDTFPTSLSQLRKASAIVRSPRLGWIILLTDNALLRLISSTLVQLQTQSSRHRVVGSMDAAMQLLERTQEQGYERREWLLELGKRLETNV